MMGIKNWVLKKYKSSTLKSSKKVFSPKHCSMNVKNITLMR